MNPFTARHNTTLHSSSHRFNAMQRNAMQCNAMQCNAMQRNATQCNAMQRNAMQRNATQCNAMQCNAMQCNTIKFPHYNSLHFYLLYDTTPCFTFLLNSPLGFNTHLFSILTSIQMPHTSIFLVHLISNLPTLEIRVLQALHSSKKTLTIV